MFAERLNVAATLCDCIAKYKTLEKLLSSTELPALVEQKPSQSSLAHVDVFEPLTLTEKVEQTFLVVNFIDDGEFPRYV